MFCQARHSDVDDVLLLSWVSGKKLGLNTNKTEATAVGASYLLSLVSTSDWTDIGCSNIPSLHDHTRSDQQRLSRHFFSQLN